MGLPIIDIPTHTVWKKIAEQALAYRKDYFVRTQVLWKCVHCTEGSIGKRFKRTSVHTALAHVIRCELCGKEMKNIRTSISVCRKNQEEMNNG